jgi:hypothetical protein
MFDWLFGKKSSAFGESTTSSKNELLLAEFGATNRIVPAYNDPTQIKERDIPDLYVRDRQRGILLDAIAKLPETRTAINFWVDAVCSSSDGDDIGLAPADHIDRKNTIPIDPQIDQLVSETIDRLLPSTTIQNIAERILTRGDHFLTTTISKNQLQPLNSLPCWQTFRREDMGKIEGYYVKQHENDQNAIRYDPKTTFQFRFRPLGKYGRAIFENSQSDAEYLLKRLFDLDLASRSSAVDPLCHEMPACATQEYLSNYRTAYQKKAAQQTITDFFLMQGGKIYRASGGNTPNLQAILSALNFNQIRLLMPAQVPFYLLGLNTQGAKEIAGEPALAFARSISTLRANLATTVRQIVNLQLTLSGIPPERQLYRLIWPKIVVNPYNQSNDDETQNEDTED